MVTRFQNLFGPEEGKSTRQQSFEQLYTTHGIDFQPVFRDAHQLTMDDPTPEVYRGRGFMAYHMNWHLIGLLNQRYPDNMKEDQYGRPYYKIDDNVRVYFKKLNNNYAPDNIATDHVRDLNSMSLFDGNERISVLYAGFRIPENKHWSELSGCFLVEMKTLKKPSWVSDLSELGYKITKSGIYAPIKTIVLPDDIIIKPKTKGSDLGNISEG